jgi:hypothetical protein
MVPSMVFEPVASTLDLGLIVVELFDAFIRMEPGRPSDFDGMIFYLLSCFLPKNSPPVMRRSTLTILD